MKKLGILILVLLAVVLAGCGQKEEAVYTDDDKQFVELIYYSIGDTPKDLDMVMAKANDYLKEKINCKVNFKILGWGDYDTKMKTALISGEPMDLAFTCSWAMNYRSNSIRGSFMPLDGLIDKYGQDMKKAINPLLFAGTKINNVNYGIPAQGSYAWQSGYYFNEALVKKYNFDYSKVKSVTDLIPLFRQIKQDNPNLIPVSNTWMLDDRATFDCIVGVGTPGAVRMDDKECKVINQFEDKDFLDHLKKTREIVTNKLTYSDAKQQYSLSEKDFKAGKAVSYIHRCPPFSDVSMSQANRFKVFTVPVYARPVVSTDAISGSFVAITSSSKHPVRAMKFLNLMNSDPYLHNLFCFGIEGVHYEKLANGQIHITQRGKENYSMPTWTLGNMFLEYVPDTEAADKWEVTRKFNAEGVLSPLFGFGYDPEPVQAELTAIANVSGQYVEQLMTGTCDIDKTAAEYTAKLKAAGMDKFLAELQKQVDTWKAGKSSR